MQTEENRDARVRALMKSILAQDLAEATAGSKAVKLREELCARIRKYMDGDTVIYGALECKVKTAHIRRGDLHVTYTIVGPPPALGLFFVTDKDLIHFTPTR